MVGELPHESARRHATAVMSLDEAEATLHAAAPDARTPTPQEARRDLREPDRRQVPGRAEGGRQSLCGDAWAPEDKLIPYKGLQFHVKEFSDLVWEFVMENEQVKALKQRDPSGEVVFPRR